MIYFLPQYDSDLDNEYDAKRSTKRTKKVRRRKKKKTTIYDVYEPSELERGHFLEKDAEIRVTDIPERLVLCVLSQAEFYMPRLFYVR